MEINLPPADEMNQDVEIKESNLLTIRVDADGARLGLGHKARALTLLRTVLRRDPNHSLAADLLREIES